MATVQRHERRVEGLACIVAGAAIGSDSEMQRFESFYPRAQAGGGRARAGGARGARSAGWRAPGAGQDPSRRGAILAVSL